MDLNPRSERRVLNRQLGLPQSRRLSWNPAELLQASGWLVANGFQAVLHVGRGCEYPTGMEEEIHFSLKINTEPDLHSVQY